MGSTPSNYQHVPQQDDDVELPSREPVVPVAMGQVISVKDREGHIRIGKVQELLGPDIRVHYYGFGAAYDEVVSASTVLHAMLPPDASRLEMAETHFKEELETMADGILALISSGYTGRIFYAKLTLPLDFPVEDIQRRINAKLKQFEVVLVQDNLHEIKVTVRLRRETT